MAETTGITTTHKKTAALPGQRLDAVHCLLLPLNGETLLLPNAAIAEIIDFESPDPISDAPAWLLGWLNWRDRRIPVISFEVASGGIPPEQMQGKRIAVLNTLNSNPRVPYVAIVLQDIPRLKLVQRDALQEGPAVSGRQSVLRQLQIEGGLVIVPDIDDLEQRVERLRS